MDILKHFPHLPKLSLGRDSDITCYTYISMPKLKLNIFQRIYKSLKTPWLPVNYLILGFLIGLEEQYIDFKAKQTVDDAIKKYKKENVFTKVTKPEVVMRETDSGWEMSIGDVDKK